VDENRSPADFILDLVVFGPAGLALTAAEEFPKLVDKGRHHLEGQVRTARLVGQVAVQMGRRQLSQMTSPKVSKPPASAPPSPPAPTPESRRTVPEPTPSHPETVTATSLSTANGNGLIVTTLAIPGYDSLSASQVVQRLAGLSHGELMDVRTHEQTHRHRRTILNRVEQLLAGVDAE
jgi:hypothetical protein